MTIYEFRDHYGIRSPMLLIQRAFDRLGYDNSRYSIPLIEEVLRMMENLENALERLEERAS